MGCVLDQSPEGGVVSLPTSKMPTLGVASLSTHIGSVPEDGTSSSDGHIRGTRKTRERMAVSPGKLPFAGFAGDGVGHRESQVLRESTRLHSAAIDPDVVT